MTGDAEQGEERKPAVMVNPNRDLIARMLK
jgi:hypothetical protein